MSLRCEIVNKNNIKAKQKEDIIFFRDSVLKSEYNRKIEDPWSEYDVESDHFIVYNNHDEILGYYRVRRINLSSIQELSKTSAASQFDLSHFYTAHQGKTIVELSRACTHRDHRDGTVISLLWLNISLFLIEYKIEAAIGATSDVEFNPHTFSYIFEKNLCTPYPVLPHKIDGSIVFEKLEEDSIKKKNVRTLIRAYGKQGASFSPVPAYDEEWNTFDYFTVFKTKDLRKKLKKNENE